MTLRINKCVHSVTYYSAIEFILWDVVVVAHHTFLKMFVSSMTLAHLCNNNIAVISPLCREILTLK